MNRSACTPYPPMFSAVNTCLSVIPAHTDANGVDGSDERGGRHPPGECRAVVVSHGAKQPLKRTDSASGRDLGLVARLAGRYQQQQVPLDRSTDVDGGGSCGQPSGRSRSASAPRDRTAARRPSGWMVSGPLLHCQGSSDRPPQQQARWPIHPFGRPSDRGTLWNRSVPVVKINR